MDPLLYLGYRRVFFLSLVLFLFLCVCVGVGSQEESKGWSSGTKTKTKMLEEQEYEQLHPLKKKSTKPSSKNAKIKTRLITETEDVVKKLNSTTLKSKKLNSTSSYDLGIAKNKTTKGTADKKTKLGQSESEKQSEKKKQGKASWELEDDDLVSELKDLPMKFQQTLLPDLERISTTSKAYISKANKEITKGFKPYVGNKYAPTIATLLCSALALIPLLLVSLLFNKIKAYFSLQKLLIFIQAYLAIYFTILSLSSLVTGLEPLRFFYSTSRSTYLCLQLLQALAYVLYLFLLLMYLVLLFSTDSRLPSKFLALAQTLVGFSVGLHYYMTVFHRVVLKQPPKTNSKIHAIYATCFFLICLLSRADTRKKTYLEQGGEEGKKN
ncbi:hypothetical protein VNO78_28380 [Psophocarpus tetragonolobus]|uniref:Uncharacterized protein n=1 Tax=Psophocarpus tetragonolobus TaxID=3891 RepID=A0AAN9S243_PSOTE